MSSLDELKRNALPSSSADGNNISGPVEYRRPVAPANMPVKSRKEVDPTTLGAPPEPPKPTVYDKLMGDLDRAIKRDQKEMMETVITPAMEAYQNNIMFGQGGQDNYFEGEIGESVTPVGSMSDGVSEYNASQRKTNPIDIPPEVASNLHKTTGENYMAAPKPEVEPEDDFLNDDSIYNNESEDPTMDNYRIGTAVPPYQQASSMTPIPSASPQQNHISDATAAGGQTIPYTTENPIQTNPVDPAIEHINPTPITHPVEVPKQTYSDKFIDEAFADDDDESTDLADVKEDDIKAMRDVVRANIKPVNNIIDLNTVRISTKPVSAGRVLAMLDTSLPTAKWVLPVTGTTFIISGLKGTEIDLLANRRQGQTDLMRNQEIVQTFYNHIATDDKPASWEAWAKSIVYDDFVHLYFGVYMACFSNANFAPFECSSDTCKHSFMDRVDMYKMVKYKDEEAERKIMALLNTDPKTGSIDVMLRQVSDNVVIAFRKPTVWNAMFEDLYLPEKIRTQMRDTVGIFRHIAEIYIYDARSGELRPIETKPVAGDMAKTLKHRFKIYYDVLRSLTSDQLTSITSIINDLHKDSDLISYQYPEFKCPKCGHVTPAHEYEPIDILFLRHQLQNILIS